MIIQTEKDLAGLLKIGRICAQTMHHMLEHVQPGMTTAELDRIGAEFLKKHHARSAPILTYNYPGSTCISINEQVAHGIPGSRVIQPGDMVNVDVSAELDGYIGDTGFSMVVAPVSEEKRLLCDRTQAALNKALDVITDGAPLNLIGRVLEQEARRHGYKIIRELGGHGVGHTLHEPPRNIPNYFAPRLRTMITEGMVFTVEPFFTTGNGRIKTEADGWTLSTVDGSLSAQFEHSLVVTKGKPVILTALS